MAFRARRAALLAAALLAVLASAGAAVLPQQTGRVDLLAQSNLRIDGATAGDEAGFAVAGAGDVNGDGLADLLVGAPERGPLETGAAYVLFGREDLANIDLGALGRDGFRITGAAPEDRAGASVAGAGDVNGDDLADVIIGAQGADNNGRAFSGSAYVVFGKRAATNIDLASLGAEGFRIDGAAGEDAGVAVAGAGDVNGDGLADVVVGADSANNGAVLTTGAAYVVLGRQSTANVDLTALGAGGFRMIGVGALDGTGRAVAGPGDLNDDGLADILIGADRADNNGRQFSGSAYVVFGQETPADVELGALGRSGFRIDGAAFGDETAGSVAGAGDVNGDGRPDLVLGADSTDNNGRLFSGSAYVVFGQQAPTNVDLAVLGGGGFRIDGAAGGDTAGDSVAGAGDLNGDGLPDVLVGASNAANNGRPDSGSIYGVIGRTAPANVDLADAGVPGLRIDGASADDGAVSAAGVGDVNGDARPDALVGAPTADNNGLAESGSAYLILGFGPPGLAYPPIAATVGVPVAVAPTTLRRTGPASFAVDPPLPAGLTLNPATGEIAGRPTAASGRTLFEVTMTDLAGSATAPLIVRADP